MKGFTESVTVDLPLSVDYIINGTNLTITRCDVAGTYGCVPVGILPEQVRDKLLADLSVAIREYEQERATAFNEVDWTLQTR